MNKPLILVVEDDPSVRNLITTTLKTNDYRYVVAPNGSAAIMEATSHNPEIILLDLGLSDMDGVQVIQTVRSWSNVPIIVISARSEDNDKIKALDAGADDYLVKPFYQQELLARVKALLRRYDALGSIRETKSENQIQVGNIVLDTAKKQLVVRGEAVRLTATEFKILQVLMSNPGRVYSAEEIYERVWESDAYAVENTVMVHISRIREKLEINPKKPEYLRVVWGIGYVFEAP